MQITAIRCYAAYKGSLKKAIISLKYHRNISLGESLASHLISLLNDLGWEIELVVPVPLGKLRYSERGYNQASLLGRPLAMAQNLDYDTSVLKKVRDTPSQVSLPLDRRLHNLKNAFYAETGKASGKSVLIVDDVVTSGATMEACASALLAAGASSVLGLALARA